MTTPQQQSAYDVFVSYSHEDEGWVRDELLPRLKDAGLKVCIDSESYQPGEPFEAGTPVIRAIERAILVSHKTICVFSPAYRESEWCELEDTLISSLDPSGREKRLLPVLLKACELPQRIKARLYVDFATAGAHDQAWGRLLAAIEGSTIALPMAEGRPSALAVAEERAGKVTALPGMQAPQYLDFELRIEKKGQGYQAAVVHSPCGEASHIFKRPFSDLELENLVLRLGGTRRGLRHIASAEMETVRQFGSKLFDVVFCDDVRSCFFSSQREAKGKSLGLRLKLRLEAPELINIPWEYLYDASRGRFLSQFEGTPIVRYIDLPEPIEPLHMKLPLSILIMASSPTDYPTLEVGSEGEKLKEALQGLADQGLVKTTWVEKANLPALADCLLHGQYHIFHYIGHGGFDERSQDGVLVLEDERRLGQLVSAERLAVLLGNEPTLRLVILNACEGARTSRTDPFAGMATTLVRTGNVPAVVAMQFAITDEAAITFARGFYSALAVGRPVDAAVTQARLAIFSAGNDVEWGTPVLYMRSPDGRIFDVEAMSPEERAAHRRAAEAARAEVSARAQPERQREVIPPAAGPPRPTALPDDIRPPGKPRDLPK